MIIGQKKVGVCLMAIMFVTSLTIFGFIEPALSQTQKSKPQPIKWKGQTAFSASVTPYGPFGPGQTGLFAGIKEWSELLKKRTGGRLVIDWAEPGAIFPITESDVAVGKGVVQISYTYGPYYGGRIPETDIAMGGIFFWEDDSQHRECLYKYGLLKAMRKVYAKHKIFWIPMVGGSIATLGTTFPAPSPEAIKGKKIRTIGTWGEYVNMLGGIPVAIPWGDIYMALKLGTVDGWVGGAASLEEIKLKEVAKGLVVSPKISTAPGDILINMPAYEALPKDIQEILEEEAPNWTYFCSSHWMNQNLWTIHNASKEYGIKPYYWSSEEKDRVTQLAADTIYPKIAAKSPDCAALLEIVKKQMRDYRRIK